MPVHNWHYGKLVILWSWGLILIAVALTHFMTDAVANSPMLHLCEVLLVLLVLILLTGVTWHWLGSKEPY